MTIEKRTLGIVGFGAFAQLMAKHLAPHFTMIACDPVESLSEQAQRLGVRWGSVLDVAASDIVVLAAPVPKMEEALHSIAPHLRAGSLVLDVGSVKVRPAEFMMALLPDHVDIVCTHPLFGPQSAKEGIKDLKIVVCPLRGDRTFCVTEFLSSLGLDVMVTTPEEHDQELAVVQGLTHLIAKVLVEMEPLPKKLTTKSFERLMEGVDMVRHDSMELFLAIERDNPYSADLRRRFFTKADALRAFLEAHDTKA